ncbi:MAG: chemotaxis protein CheW [Mariprofundaceae bacterium]|nr:chemotaxis protein CheW [Mariprofundaceae bacterium]
MIECDDEIMQEFLLESHENLDRMVQDLLMLEQQPKDRNLLDSIFRTIHTVKGSCGFVGLPYLEAVSHAGEALLVRLRDGELLFNESLATLLLQLIDAIRVILQHVEAHAHEGEHDYHNLIEQLQQVDQPTTSATVIATTEKTANNQPAHHEPVEGLAVKEHSHRVAIAKLDQLLDLFGELMLEHNGLGHANAIQQDASLFERVQKQKAILSHMHQVLLSTRMQAIGETWRSFPRWVRDVALEHHKKINFHMIGTELEVDRLVLEKCKPLLIHLLRNAVDHGIELEQQRCLVGKPAYANITLQAEQRLGGISISVGDDGAGVDVEKIRQKAVQRGMFTVEQARQLADDEVYDLLFNAGFSTAETITNLSGRGVGLDAVKAEVELLGGVININSTLGKSSCFDIRLPLTLAMMPSLLVRSGNEILAISQTKIQHLVVLNNDTRSPPVIESIHGILVYLHGNDLLPLLHLNELLMRRSTPTETTIIIVKTEDGDFALMVDEVIDTQDIVIKPLPFALRKLKIYQACTILNHGRIALILAMSGVAKHAAVIAKQEGIQHYKQAHHNAANAAIAPAQLLMIRGSHGGRQAIPLEHVYRVEVVAERAIEMVHGRQVVQWYDHIIPLVNMALGSANQPKEEAHAYTSDGMMQVVVCVDQNRYIGLVVAEVLDTVDVHYGAKNQPNRDEVAFTTVIEQQVTEVLSLSSIIKMAKPEFFIPWEDDTV